MMTTIDDGDLVTYVVWSSQLGAEERHVEPATALMPDPRARHFWDADQVVGWSYTPKLGTGAAAWDVWMLFGRDARWDDGPPDPAWWEHQLGGLDRARRLDPERFTERARTLLREGRIALAGADEL